MSDSSPVRFIVLMLGRTGSSLLVEALDSHSRVRARGEAFGHHSKRPPGRQIERIRDFYTTFDGSAGVVGFKLKYRDIGSVSALADLMRDLEIRVIHLQRRNRVKHVVSFFNAVRLFDATGGWNLYEADDRLGAFRLDPRDFAERLETMNDESAALAAYVAALELPTLDLSYEDLLTHRNQTIARVFSFLGVGSEPVKPAALKNTPDDLRLVVRNFEQLYTIYRGTLYEAMFDEVLVELGASDESL